ncbi:hypothetical protein C8R43DRAFT_1239645 [Mycena crocata]|nr:hypothetical protein C8R43DRAFT_1239645 [Mycena crocata]
MTTTESEPSRPNTKARTLFNDGKFVEAGLLYGTANSVDTQNSLIYLANFALVQLKIKKWPCPGGGHRNTGAAARPKFHNARYRRAIARQRQGRLTGALVDLADVLTAEPTDKAALAAFAAVSRELKQQGPNHDFSTPTAIMRVNDPPAYGSAAVPSVEEVPVRNANAERRPAGVVIPDCSARIPKELRAVTCAACKAIEIKTCRGCNTAVYCDAVCQRKPWPMHRNERIPYDEDNVLAMHLCRNLLDHKFLRMNIFIYAMRAIGALHHPAPPPYVSVLLLFIKMVPLAPGPRRRLCITNIVTVPLAVLDKDMRDSYDSQLQQMRDTCAMPDAPGVAMLVTPVPVGREASSSKARTMIFMHRLVPDLVLTARQFVFNVGFESHSFGTSRKITPDLDVLYWSPSLSRIRRSRQLQSRRVKAQMDMTGDCLDAWLNHGGGFLTLAECGYSANIYVDGENFTLTSGSSFSGKGPLKPLPFNVRAASM